MAERSETAASFGLRCLVSESVDFGHEANVADWASQGDYGCGIARSLVLVRSCRTYRRARGRQQERPNS